MWHPTGNGEWTPHTISVASSVEVCWVCPAGHEWTESVRDRVASRKWKRGRVEACGLCVGFHVLESCACGNQRMVKASPPPSGYECWSCARAKRAAQEEQRRLREQARTGYDPSYAETDAMLDLIVPARLPPALEVQWRLEVRTRVHSAMVNERGYGEYGTVGAIDEALSRIQDEGDLLPTTEQLLAAHTQGEPIQFMRRTFWTQGVLHVLGIDVPGRSRDRGNVASLRRWVRTGVERRARAGHYQTAEMTQFITSLVQQWGEQERRPWRSFVELTPPFIPTDGEMCGAIDMILTRPRSLDLVIEIDAAHNPRSLEKLQFADTAGATAVWIRWHDGSVRHSPEIHIIDLVNQTKRSKGV
jgi:hypothetical protein